MAYKLLSAYFKPRCFIWFIFAAVAAEWTKCLMLSLAGWLESQESEFASQESFMCARARLSHDLHAAHAMWRIERGHSCYAHRKVSMEIKVMRRRRQNNLCVCNLPLHEYVSTRTVCKWSEDHVSINSFIFKHTHNFSVWFNSLPMMYYYKNTF